VKFVDMKNDIAFKKVFGNSDKKGILISFLNAVLDFKDEKMIKDVDILNSYQLPKIKELKETILDIRATNQNNEKFIVEMQRKDLGDFDKRSEYYAAKTYVEQLEKGKSYSTLKKVYFIGIVNFKIFGNEDYVSRHWTVNRETGLQELDGMEFAFVELPKFKKKLNQLETITDKWVYFIKNARKMDMIPKEFENIEEFQEAFKIANQYNWNKDEMEVYDYMILKEIDEVNALKTAEKKGEIKGEIRGKKEGKMEGKKEREIEIAKNSLKQNLDIKTISLITGLTAKEIEDLKIRNKI